MKYSIKIILLSLFIHGCSNDNTANNTTELEGSWVSPCSSFVVSNNLASSHTVITFLGNTVSAITKTYSGLDCITFTSSATYDGTQLLIPKTANITFTAGDTVTTSNGVLAKELNYIDSNSTVTPDIFLLQDNANTLLLGQICPIFNTTQPQVCTGGRPTVLNYANFFTKQN